MNLWTWFESLVRTYPFSMQMTGHMILAQVLAPFLLLAVPRKIASRKEESPATEKLKGLLSHRSVTWLVGMGAMWAWHLPALCHAVASHSGLESVEDISFLLSGIVFWWPIFSPLPRERMTPVPWAVLYLVSGCLGCTVLGILLAFSPSAGHGGMPDITAADQHTGGLIMWVPGCLVYLAAVIAMFARWYGTPEETVLEYRLPSGSELTR